MFTYYDESEVETLDLLWGDKGRGKYVRSDETRAKISIANQNRSKEELKEYGKRAIESRIANGNQLMGNRILPKHVLRFLLNQKVEKCLMRAKKTEEKQ